MKIKYLGDQEFQAYARESGKYYVFNPALPESLIQDVSENDAKELMGVANFEIVTAADGSGNEVPEKSAAKKGKGKKKL